MKKNIKLALLSVLAVLSLSMTAVFTAEVKAENALTSDICSGDYDATQKAAAGCSEDRSAGNVVTGVIDVVIGVASVISVVVLIYGGAQYVISRGMPDKIAKSKQIIMYSIIGLMISLLAYAIVNFVLSDALNGSSPVATGGTSSGDTSSGSSSSGSSSGGSSSKVVVELSDLDSCKKKEHSTCKVNGVEFIRLKDGNLWAKSWDSSLKTFDDYMNYSCPVGKKPTKKVYDTLVGKYSGGELGEQLSKISFFGDTNAQSATVYWSTTKVSGSDNVYLLRATGSDASVVSFLPANPDIKNGSASYGILCYVDSK